MNPQLTCSQRQWLHSSVGRASHRYREVTGSNPVEVLDFFFFQASLRNCLNCVSLRRSYLHFISFPQFIYMIHFIYHQHSFLSREHMNPQLTCSQRQWLHSSVGRASHRYREVTGSNPVEVLDFFFFQASLRNCLNCVSLRRSYLHFISFPQFIYMIHFIYHQHSFLSREHMNPQLTCSQRQWLHSSVGRASHRYREVTGSNPVEVLDFFFSGFFTQLLKLRFTATIIPSFHFISAVHIYDSFHISSTLISFTGTYEPTIDLLPTSVAS